MDHIANVPPNHRLKKDMIIMPWLGFDHDTTKRYPAVSFASYPRQRGWTNTELEGINGVIPIPTRTNSELLAMLQSWMLFGFVENVLRLTLTSDILLRYDRKLGVVVVDTSELPNMVQKLQEDISKMSVEEEVERFNVMRKGRAVYVAIANILTGGYGNRDGPSRLLCSLDKSGIEGVLIMAEMLLEMHGVLEGNLHRSGVWSVAAMTRIQYRPMYREHLRKRLVKKGYCPSFYSRFFEFGMSTLEFAALLEPVEPPEEHQSCTEERCEAINVDESTYKTKHRTPGCSCAAKAVPISEAVDILQNGNFFLVDIQSLLGGKNSAVVPYTPGLQFIAFSHVWAHGLGSCTEDGLPTCQLESILGLIRTHTLFSRDGLSPLALRSPLVWMDSLCIPRDPKGRRSAIRQMSNIYSLASRTIVLDRDISSLDVMQIVVDFTPTMLAAALRVLTCAWMARLWTLQEAALSKSLYFLFKGNVLVSMDVLLSKLGLLQYNPVVTQVRHQLGRIDKTRGPMDLQTAINIGSRRECSKLADEPLAIGSLVGMDVGMLLEEKKIDERMEKFWWATAGTQIGARILFVGDEKLSTPGLRWAPKKLTSPSKDDIVSGPEANVIPGVGLSAKLWVVVFDDSVELEIDANNMYIVQRIHECPERGVGGECSCANPCSNSTPTWRLMRHGTAGTTFTCDAIAFEDKPQPSAKNWAIALTRDSGEGVFKYGGRVFAHPEEAPQNGWTVVPARGSNKKICIT